MNSCISLQSNSGQSVSPPRDSVDTKAEVDVDDSNAPLTHCPITLEVLKHDNKTSEEIKKIFSKKLKYRYFSFSLHFHGMLVTLSPKAPN